MNSPAQNLPAKVSVVAGGQVSALIPQSLDEAFRVANAVAISGLAPRGMDRPEQVLVAVMAGAELGMPPYQAIQSYAVVNGRATLWGDAIPALLWARGFKIAEWFDNDDEPTKAFCKVTRPDGTEIERCYTLADAKAAGLLNKQGPWASHRKRMMQMRARAFAARDGAADVLRGTQVREEVEDYGTARDVTPRGAGTGMRARLEARAAEVTEPNGGFDPEFVESELTEEIADADFTEEADVAPEVTEEADAPDTEWDAIAYAEGQRDNAARIDDEPTLRSWWSDLSTSDDFLRLIDVNQGEALATKAFVLKRLKILKGEATA